MPIGATAGTLADITEALTARFDGRLAQKHIARMVHHCRRELTITDGTAPSNTVMRLAAERLERLEANRQTLQCRPARTG